MEKIFIYLTNISSNVGYFIVFGILLACGLGFPLPEDVPLVASGYLLWDGTFEVIPTFIVTITGILIGDTTLFFIGKKIGMKVISDENSTKSFLKPKRVRRVKAYFRKFGDRIVFFARFLAGLRAVAFAMSGAMGIQYKRFIFLDFLAALLSVPIWLVLGYGLGHFFGDEIGSILKSLKNFKHVITGITILLVAIFAIRIIIRYRKAKPRKNEADLEKVE